MALISVVLHLQGSMFAYSFDDSHSANAMYRRLPFLPLLRFFLIMLPFPKPLHPKPLQQLCSQSTCSMSRAVSVVVLGSYTVDAWLDCANEECETEIEVLERSYATSDKADEKEDYTQDLEHPYQEDRKTHKTMSIFYDDCNMPHMHSLWKRVCGI